MEGKDNYSKATSTNLNEKKREKGLNDNCQAGADYTEFPIIKCRPWIVQGERKIKVQTQHIFENNFSKQ